jgi:formate C-acetyltransferase
MSMTDRVRKLRQQSLDAEETLSSERAELLTDFYRAHAVCPNESIPVKRALAFQYLMEYKTVVIGEGELIVGEKGPAPKHAPTYPELCCHTLADLDILNSRPKTSFKVAPETRKAYGEKVIPFWGGRSLRDRLFAEMTDDWNAAYEAGIFTEFMEQRAPGHTVLDGKIYHKGMLDFIAEIEARLASLDYLNDREAYAKQEELKAMRLCAQALVRFGERYAEEARRQAQVQNDPQLRAELEIIAEVCTHVPGHAPRDFHEALQYYWFVHLGVTTELNTWDSFCPGHLDRHLMPFYDLNAYPREYI